MEFFNVSFIVLIIVLLIAAVYDIKTMEVPIFLWLIPIVYDIFHNGIQFQKLLLSLGIFLLFFTFNLVTNFGGADTLLMTSIVYVMGNYGIYSCLFAFLAAIPYTLYLHIKKKEKAYPFVPFLFFGVLVSQTLTILL